MLTGPQENQLKSPQIKFNKTFRSISKKNIKPIHLQESRKVGKREVKHQHEKVNAIDRSDFFSGPKSFMMLADWGKGHGPLALPWISP